MCWFLSSMVGGLPTGSPWDRRSDAGAFSAECQLGMIHGRLTVNDIDENGLDVTLLASRKLRHRRDILPVPVSLLGFVVRSEVALRGGVDLRDHTFDDYLRPLLALRPQSRNGAISTTDLISLSSLDEATVDQHSRAAVLATVERENQVVAGDSVTSLRPLKNGRAGELATKKYASERKVGENVHAATSATQSLLMQVA